MYRRASDWADVLPLARYSGVRMSLDKKVVYYSRYYPRDGSRVFSHVIGGGDNDTMLLGKSYRDEKLGEIDYINVQVTENGHYLLMSISRGVPAKRMDLLLKDLRVKDSPIVPLVYGYDSRFVRS